MSVVLRSVLGVVGGLAATGAMDAVAARAERAGLVQPPRRLGAESLPGASDATREVVDGAVHYGYGAVAGLAYAVLVPKPLKGVVGGAAFGIAVWRLGYADWLPRLELATPSEPRGRVASIVTGAQHAVYGAVLGTVVGRWR
jgi:hypothetical protein